jgi:hypothetical protein
MLHYSILMWIYPHESSLNSILAYAKHKIFIITLYLGGSILANLLTLPSKLSIPCLSSQEFMLYLSHHKIIRNLKILHQPLSIVCIVWLCLLGSVCLCWVTPVAIDWKERTCIVERSKRVWTSKRQVTHIFPTHFTICISVLLVVCMIGWFSKKRVAMLEPSSLEPPLNQLLVGCHNIEKWCHALFSNCYEN